MIVIVDSGVANLASVQAAFERLGVAAQTTSDAATIAGAARVVLPGVGSAQAAMRRLEQRRLVPVIRNLAKPVLGICLGMQLLFDSSEEGGGGPCLGVIPGVVRKLSGGEALPIPHMGWNEIAPVQDHPLLEGLAAGTFMYFVHSFAVPPGPASLAECVYGEAFTAMCGYKNFFGCQFHPERSGEAGERVLRNFLEMNV